MPYIPPGSRPALDAIIEPLARAIAHEAEEYGYDGAYAGLLNYSISRLAELTLPARRYWALQLTKGVLDGAADEFKRRVIDPYEDEQIVKNGDLPGYGRTA